MSGEQLERSVLEHKERDELHVIAQAFGLKPGRSKKADVIDQILSAAGVGGSTNGAGGDNPDGAAGDKPKRARRSPPRPAVSERRDGAVTATPSSTSSTQAAIAAAIEMPTVSAEVVAPDGEGVTQGRNGNGDGGRNRNRDRTDRGDRNRNNNDRNNNRDQGDDGSRRSRRRRGGQGGQGGGSGHGGPGGQRFERGERDLPGHGQEVVYEGDPMPVTGVLDLRDEGFGFLRTSGYRTGREDVYVSLSQVKKSALRKGDQLVGTSRPAVGNEKYAVMLDVLSINGQEPEKAQSRPRFEDLTPLFPDSRLALEVPGDTANMTSRIVDLISPIGKGQRGLIVSPPKAGKTSVMKQIAHSIESNNPDVHLIVLLVDERPEEVTDMRRSVKGEVIASTFDRPSEEHTQLAEIAIERAKRLVEMGRDVVIILDGITRLARAYNLAAPATGRIMSGGIDTGALYPPKKFFGAARNVEEGGSLTILATALVDTGSKMDEVIFEEFKGTGNMELRLDRRIAERRIYPAIDVNASSTRHEELLFDRTQLQQVYKLRRVLNALAQDGSAAAGLELLMDKIKSTKSNDEFLAEIAKGSVATA